MKRSLTKGTDASHGNTQKHRSRQEGYMINRKLVRGPVSGSESTGNKFTIWKNR